MLKAEWPKHNIGKSKLIDVHNILEFNSNVWKEKKPKNISLRNEISGIKIPKELKDFEKDLKSVS